MTERGYNVGFKLVHIAALQQGVFNLFAAPVGLYRGYSSGVLYFIIAALTSTCIEYREHSLSSSICCKIQGVSVHHEYV